MNYNTLRVNEHELEFLHISSRGRGPCLVLLHEGLGCIAMWKDFPTELSRETGLDVFAYSRASYGGSSPGEFPRAIDFHTREARDILPAVLDNLEISSCILVGHSDGASIALLNAAIVQDPRVKGIVALSPHVLNESRCREEIRSAVDEYESGNLRAKLKRYHGSNVDYAFRGWSDTWLSMEFLDWDFRSCLSRTHCPVLTIRGVEDPYNTSIHLDAIRQEVGQEVEAHELADCGHFPHVEQKIQTVKLVSDWFKLNFSELN